MIRGVDDALSLNALKAYLDPVVDRFERREFIDRDPVSILHGFDDPRDQEIIGIFAALLAWGRRDIMLRKLEELCERMRYRPFEFVRKISDGSDARRLHGFVHRTFNESDALWLSRSLGAIVRKHGSIDALCAGFMDPEAPDACEAIQGLGDSLLAGVPGIPDRVRKHVPRPSTGSACKRLNLFLRWMVRHGPVDLGIWEAIRPDQLLLPLDVHSARQARAVGLLRRKTDDWRATLELTEACRMLHPGDPVRYDFAFFGTGEAGETLSAPPPSWSET